jgi:outer membrane protein assembly factor BamA
VFPPSELRNHIPLDDGDVFDLGRIRQGIVAVSRLYTSLGYTNFTASPDIRIDHNHQSVSVVFELNEDQQFRLGSVEVLGLDREASDHLSLSLEFLHLRLAT